MAIYNASLLISASNATYFTNVTGGIAAVDVRTLNDSWISSSALLTGSQTFVGTQTIKSSGGTPLIVDHSDASPTQNTLIAILKSGSAAWSIGNQGTDDSFIVYNPDTFQIPFSVRQDNSVNIEGSLTASLQTGYLYVGNASGKTQAVATSSIVTNINTGSFATTGSNTFNGNQIINGVGYNEALTIVSENSDQSFLIYRSGSVTQNWEFGITGPGNSFLKTRNRTWVQNDGYDGELMIHYLPTKFEAGIYTSGPANTLDITGSLRVTNNLSSNDIFVTGSAIITQNLTASLQQGYAWVGGVGNVSTAVATSSFGSPLPNGTISSSAQITSLGFVSSSVTASSLVTASVNLNTITFTKGDASTFSLTVNTGSGGGGSTDTGSLLVTASFDTTTRDITFTKGNASTFKLGGFAITGSNTFIGSQTIQSGSQIIFNGLNGSSNDNGLAWGTSTSYPAKLFYQSGSSGNFLQFAGDVGIDFSVGSPATANSNINFRTQNAAGQIQFTSDSSSISLKSGTSTTISGSSVAINGSGAAGITNRGVVSIGQNIGTALGEVYMLGYSGSLVLGAQTQSPTYAALSHISSSQPNGNINLIFKSNSNAGTTIVSGSNNIFVNPSTPTTGYIKYVGGNNNIYLNNNAGVSSEITASAISISGTRPLMNSNIWQGNSTFIINQAPNSGTGHVYSNNIFGQANNFTINALAYTGSSFTLSDNIFKNGLNTINPASASLAEIAAGVSGSAGSGFEFVRNIMIGTSQATINIGPKMSNPTFNSYIGNVFNGGALQITNISSSLQVNANSNFGQGFMIYTNAGAAGLALHRTAGAMSTNYGSQNLIASASAIVSSGNVSPASLAVTNQSFSGSLGSGSISTTNNAVFGASNTYLVTGSYGGTLGAGAQFSSNGIFGVSNTLFTEVTGRGNSVNFGANVIGGSNLILTGSQNLTLNEAGGAHFGRWNVNDGRRNATGETIFSVGTGVSGSRKTGFLIDSGSNTFVEGSLNVSGSTALTGSLAVSSFTTLASVSSSLNFADDTAAAAGGVPLGGLYRNGNFVMIRLT